ncbi:hypothetical protein C3744_23660 [Priestia megaterium]|uniref:Uncharacterized protein n=1 Tax=Priestia megaterium TaxID=1404 RepID=A0A3D8WWQ5_PRIMG|nr:hypothetical protein [Priestia megaterium]MDH3169449.1 hypothetical protein [Priestia megaterium]RDZ10098.1 hypothetical protein C3744_23660 [Priestia megaterium]
MYQMRIFTLRDGTKRKIKIEEGMTLQDELKKAGITESDIFQMQLVIQEGDKESKYLDSFFYYYVIIEVRVK